MLAAVRHPLVALVGNPNTGKTTLFNALAGMNQRVGNYPGVTVETKKGKLKHRGKTIEVIDLPGTYSLAARSPDEMVAVDLILGHAASQERPDVVVTIVDASSREIVAAVEVGNGPHGVRASEDGHWIYAAVTTDNSLAVIDSQTLEVVRKIPVNGEFPFWMAVQGNP